MLQRIRYVSEVTPRGCYVSGTLWKLLQEDGATYQKRLGSYLSNMLWRIKDVLQISERKCLNVPGTCWNWLEEDVPTYHERLDVLETTSRNLAGNRSWERIHKNAITPPRNPTLPPPPLPPQKITMCKSDSSPASQGAPSPRRRRKQNRFFKI